MVMSSKLPKQSRFQECLHAIQKVESYNLEYNSSKIIKMIKHNKSKHLHETIGLKMFVADINSVNWYVCMKPFFKLTLEIGFYLPTLLMLLTFGQHSTLLQMVRELILDIRQICHTLALFVK